MHRARDGNGHAAVFLDRDGVINASEVRHGKPYPPDSLESFRLLPGVKDAIQDLRQAGYVIVVATNQPDVGRGHQRQSVVEAIHDHLRAELAVDDIRVCYHDDKDRCHCRKPKPGMLVDAAAELGIDLGRSYMVGDRWRDIGAGKAAGCRTFFIDYHYAEANSMVADHTVASLAEAASMILSAGDP